MKIGDWLRNRSNKQIQYAIIILSSFIVLARIIDPGFRSAIDVVTIIMACVLLLAILRRDIKSLISQMNGIGFPGTQIPITSLKEEVHELEKKYSYTFNKYKNTDSDLLHGLNQKFIIDEKIEAILFDIASEYKKLSNNETLLTSEGTALVDFLVEVDVIGKDIYQVSKKYLLVDDDKEKESTVIRLGRKIVRLLSSIWKRFKDLRILSSATNTDFRDSLDTKASLTGINYSVSKNRNTISLFTTFNLVDELDYGYPILGIEKEDVKIRELVGNDKIDVEIIDVSSLDESVNIYVCLLIDCSTSMKDNNKIGYAKDAAINLVKGFFNSKSGLNIHFSIYPVTSINDYGFHYFDEGRQWSNSFKELHQAINSLAPNGDTPLLDALNSTLQYIDDQNGYKYIICVSDGADNISATDYANIFKEVQKRETPIFSIGYGEEEHLSGLVSISELSKAGIQGQGSFMKVHPNELINVFSYLGSVVNNAYRVIWKPSKYEMGKVRKFELSVEINSTDKNKTLITFYNLEYRMK